MGDIQCGRKSFVQGDPGLGQLTQQYQAVTGAVDTSSTPLVQYTYSDPSAGSSGFAERVELVNNGAVEIKEIGG